MPRKAAERQPSSLEERFMIIWAQVAAGTSVATLESEVRLKPKRYRFDFLVPGTNILIECQGGTWSRRRLGHSTGAGQHRDYAKLRYAQMMGYQIFPYDTKQVNEHELALLFDYVVKRFPDQVHSTRH